MIDAWNNLPAFTSLGCLVNLINCRFQPTISNKVITNSQLLRPALLITSNETITIASE
jgi:hypothetical protein